MTTETDLLQDAVALLNEYLKHGLLENAMKCGNTDLISLIHRNIAFLAKIDAMPAGETYHADVTDTSSVELSKIGEDYRLKFCRVDGTVGLVTRLRLSQAACVGAHDVLSQMLAASQRHGGVT